MSLYAWSFVALLGSAGLDIAANMCLALSKGFTRPVFGVGALVLISLAFALLGVAIRGIDLSVAYALWGAFGVLGTSIGGWILLGQKIHLKAWLGMLLLTGGVFVLHIG